MGPTMPPFEEPLAPPFKVPDDVIQGPCRRYSRSHIAPPFAVKAFNILGNFQVQGGLYTNTSYTTLNYYPKYEI